MVPSCGKSGPLRCLIDVSSEGRSPGQAFTVYIVALQGLVRSDPAVQTANTSNFVFLSHTLSANDM